MHWFKKCNFWKNSLSHLRGRWGQEVIFEVAEAKFWISSSFNKFWFRIFVVLGFEVVWPQRPRRPQKGLSEFFQKLHFWNQCIKLRKMSYSSALWSKFSLNLSTEEVWNVISLVPMSGVRLKGAVHHWNKVRIASFYSRFYLVPKWYFRAILNMSSKHLFD